MPKNPDENCVTVTLEMDPEAYEIARPRFDDLIAELDMSCHVRMAADKEDEQGTPNPHADAVEAAEAIHKAGLVGLWLGHGQNLLECEADAIAQLARIIAEKCKLAEKDEALSKVPRSGDGIRVSNGDEVWFHTPDGILRHSVVWATELWGPDQRFYFGENALAKRMKCAVCYSTASAASKARAALLGPTVGERKGDSDAATG